MPPERNEDEDEIRDEFLLAFEAFDKGELTHENAHTFELPEQPAKQEKVEGAVPGDQAEKKDDSRDGQRDQRGRFAKGEGEAPAGDKQPGAQTPPVDGKQPAEQKPQGQQEPAAPANLEPAPQGLSAKAASIWAGATPEARAYIRETEGALDQISNHLKPVMEGAREHQLPWNTYAERLAKADKFLRSSPTDAMLWLAETHGVDLDDLADKAAAKRAGLNFPQQNQQPHSEINRAVQPIAAQVQELRSQLNQREQHERQAAEREANARQAAVKKEFDTFAASPEAEHWKVVEGDVLALIPRVRAELPDAPIKEVLKTAYDRAIWANPTARAKVLAKQQQQQQDQNRANRTRNLEAVTGHRGAPNSGGRKPNGTGDSLRDEISETWAAYDAR